MRCLALRCNNKTCKRTILVSTHCYQHKTKPVGFCLMMLPLEIVEYIHSKLGHLHQRMLRRCCKISHALKKPKIFLSCTHQRLNRLLVEGERNVDALIKLDGAWVMSSYLEECIKALRYSRRDIHRFWRRCNVDQVGSSLRARLIQFNENVSKVSNYI